MKAARSTFVDCEPCLDGSSLATNKGEVKLCGD
jgi:hypothetical protein